MESPTGQKVQENDFSDTQAHPSVHTTGLLSSIKVSPERFLIAGVSIKLVPV